jgi:phosphatidylglycerol:prolipoprotein diacylglycerol transferase
MHPVLVRIGNFDVAFYGPLIAIGVLVAVFVAVRRAKTVGLSTDLVLDLTFYSVIIGFVGSRVFFILQDLRGFAEAPRDYIFTRQGYVFFGGLVPALAFAIWYLRKKQADPWQVGDVAAPSIALGHMFGRIGCFFSGCCYGRLCPPGWESWGVTFPKVTDPATGEVIFSFSYMDHLARGLIGPDAVRSLPIFPTQLYEATANFLVFLGLTWLWRRRRFRGQIFAGYLMAYGIARFLLEFLRGDYDEQALFSLLQRGQMSQVFSLTAVGVGVFLWLLRRGAPLEAPTASPSAMADKQPLPREKLDNAPKGKRNHRRR